MIKELAFASLLLLLVVTGCSQQSLVATESSLTSISPPTSILTQIPSSSPATEKPLYIPTTTKNTPKPTLTPVITYGEYEVINVNVTGPEEVVFDWTTDRCEKEDIPDLPARAFRDADGQVQLIATQYINHRMIGDTLDSVKRDCAVILKSGRNPDPSKYDDCEWLASPYTFDGYTIYALVHNEYHGWEHAGMSQTGDTLIDVYTSLTLAKSVDKGKSYSLTPNYLVATLPYKYVSSEGPVNISMPSNIVHNPVDDYFYAFVTVQLPKTSLVYISEMRTKTLDDPRSWRAWDGQGFNMEFVDPYASTPENPPKHIPVRILDPNMGGSSLSFNTYFNKWLVVGSGNTFNNRTNESFGGFCFSLSDDLIHWSKPQLLMEFQQNWPPSWDEEFRIYPSLLDPQDVSRNFEITGQTSYLYFTHGYHFMSENDGYDRDLVRVPIKFTRETPETAWEFNKSGDDEGWYPVTDLTQFTISEGLLKTSSIGIDPYMHLDRVLCIDSSIYNRVEIRMKVNAGFSGQFFFTTTEDTEWSEEKSVKFDISLNNDFTIFFLDMKSVKTWAGTIKKIRLDPTHLPADIEIDYIRIYHKQQ
jgi:hypothetical protein